MNIDDIQETDCYVLVAGGFYDFVGTMEQTVTDLQVLMQGEGLFVHKSPRSGIVSMVKLTAGTPVQIMLGKELKSIIRSQQYASMAQQSSMRPNNGGPRRM